MNCVFGGVIAAGLPAGRSACLLDGTLGFNEFGW